MFLREGAGGGYGRACNRPPVSPTGTYTSAVVWISVRGRGDQLRSLL